MQLSKDRIGALFFLALSVAYGFYATEIRLYPGDELEPMTARTLPFVLAILGVALSIVLLIVGKHDDTSSQVQILHWKPVISLLLLSMLYGFTLNWLGFIIATSLFLIGGFWILGERRIKILFMASIPFVVFFWYCLTQLLDIYLTPARLFSKFF